jgi:hypothetical protein
MSEEKSVSSFKKSPRLQKKIEKLLGPYTYTPEEKLAIWQVTEKLKQQLKDLALFVEEASKPKATETRKKAETEAAASEPVRDLTRAIGDLHRDLQRQEMRRIVDRSFAMFDEVGEPKSAQGVKKGEPIPEQGANRGKDDLISPSEKRARTVATIIGELDILRPEMFGQSDYDRLERENPNFLTFKVAAKQAGLQTKVLNVQDHHRHYRLAQELAAAYHGRKLSTLQTDWKDHKPKKFQRTSS